MLRTRKKKKTLNLLWDDHFKFIDFEELSIQLGKKNPLTEDIKGIWDI